MDPYRVFRSDWFKKKVIKLDASERARVENMEQKLMSHPHEGKPLGCDYIREKKIGDKRMLFLVYDEYRIIFLVTISTKKTQQAEITIVKANLDAYRDVVERWSRGLTS